MSSREQAAETNVAKLRLVEVVGLVAVLGVVAVIAAAGWRTTHCVVWTGEARATLLSIRGAEDAYRSEFLEYRGCAPRNDLADAAGFYPRPLGALDQHKVAWDAPSHPSYACWTDLNVRTGGPVRFSYSTVAGHSGPVVATRPATVPAASWPYDGRATSDAPYFIAMAEGVDGEGHRSTMYTSSVGSDVTVLPSSDD